MKPLFVFFLCLVLIPSAFAELPEETTALLQKLQVWELEQQVELQKEIRAKRSEVLKVLREQLNAATRAGNLERALSIKKEVERMAPLVVEKDKAMLGVEDEKVRIPKEAHRGENSHYLWVDRYVSWVEAQAECEKMGGHLVCIDNEEEWQEVLAYRDEAGFRGRRFWLGLSAGPAETDYKWVDESQFDFENWSVQPVGKPEATGVLAGMNGAWIAFGKEETPGSPSFICEWPRK